MNKNLFEIKEKSVEKNIANAHNTIKSFEFKYNPDKDLPPSQRKGYIPGAGSVDRAQRVTLIKTIEEINESNPIATETQHQVISALLRGVAIAGAVGEQFEKQSELGRLIESNRHNRLNPEDRSRYEGLIETRSAATLHTLASFVVHQLAESVEQGQREAEDVTAITIKSPLEAIKSGLFELEKNIKNNAQTDKQLISVTVSLFNKVMDEVAMHTSGLVGSECFTSFTYEVKQDGFEISGFERPDNVAASSIDMDFVEPKEVVGNAIAKHQCMRLARMIMCYDFERQLNPFAELGGHIFTFLGDGNPGTGKTTVIKMMAGLLDGYCEMAGYPFYYENFGPDRISSYQGTSGKNAKDFVRNVLNPKVIGFGTIDDIDMVAGKRGDKQSSAGQQEVTAVLMDSFAGANTRVLGNCSFGMFSNYPENVDDALRQRAGARFLIDGPQTLEDYVDILSLLLGSNHNIPVGDHDLFVTQEIKAAVSESYAKHNLPEEPALLDIYKNTIEELGDLNTQAKIGRYLKKIQEAEPRFTGRAVKNITDAVKVRAMDFDMPDEWFETPEVFLHKSYDEKLEMLKELRLEITCDMLLQEINRYSDSEFRYSAKSDDAAISGMVKNIVRQVKANELAKAEL